jgi:hypothetical protein
MMRLANSAVRPGLADNPALIRAARGPGPALVAKAW